MVELGKMTPTSGRFLGFTGLERNAVSSVCVVVHVTSSTVTPHCCLLSFCMLCLSPSRSTVAHYKAIYAVSGVRSGYFARCRKLKVLDAFCRSLRKMRQLLGVLRLCVTIKKLVMIL